ncbi:copper-translocating P-type ATPase [Thermoflexus sp.]|uniref:copper-translocating P-type ATPase n=1 Tax=Thermoflexus sp. TaxID=1969742 RepID=UPI0035E4669D
MNRSQTEREDQHDAHMAHPMSHEHMHPTAGAPEGHSAHAMPEPPARHAAHAGRGKSHIDHTGHERMFRTRFWICLALSVPVLIFSPALQRGLGLEAPVFPGSEWIPFLFSLVIFGYGGVPFLQMAVPELRHRRPGMMTLISLAISIAFVYSLLAQLAGLGEGFFWELVTLIDVMLLGHWLEMRSVRQASGALNELAKLMPDTAERLLPDGRVETVPTSALRVGDLVLVRPGASVPADGEVVEGESSVNEAMISGESRPVRKQPGAKVIAGTINGDGSLRIRVTATGDQTALAGIMRLVEQAQQSKSPTQVLADRAAGWLFYIALAVAALTAVGWIVAVGFNVEVLKRVVTVLVIACPHALGLAVPLVVAITTALGAKNGILVRDRLALEAARDIDVVVFDKTGTLTEGQFGVVGMAVAEGWSEEDALALAAAIEGDSEHPIAQALHRAAQGRGLALPSVSGFTALKGRGVQASLDGKPVYVGGPRLLEMLGLRLPAHLNAFAQAAGEKVQSAVYLVADGQVVAAFAVADVVRPESKEAVRRLHEMGVEVAMLTGDSREVAQAVAAELGIDRFFAEVLPEHKVQKIAELQAQGKRVAMVGDGINDAPALTKADVGIAIGGGTNVAIESAGVILVKSNPLDVVKVIALSRASYRKMVQNLWWAAGYNIIALPLAAGVLAPWGILFSPALGALFMSLSTVIVAINAQLLRGERLSAAVSAG